LSLFQCTVKLRCIFIYCIQYICFSVDYSTVKSKNEAVRVKRNELFGQEKARQMALVTRIEKIEVQHVGPPENCTLLMNKDLSTPFNCAMRESICTIFLL